LEAVNSTELFCKPMTIAGHSIKEFLLILFTGDHERASAFHVLRAVTFSITVITFLTFGVLQLQSLKPYQFAEAATSNLRFSCVGVMTEIVHTSKSSYTYYSTHVDDVIPPIPFRCEDKAKQIRLYELGYNVKCCSLAKLTVDFTDTKGDGVFKDVEYVHFWDWQHEFPGKIRIRYLPNNFDSIVPLARFKRPSFFDTIYGTGLVASAIALILLLFTFVPIAAIPESEYPSID
jgi:hypothetical protein